MKTTVELDTEFIALSALLKHAGVVGTGGEAKYLIQEGLVRVDGNVETRRGAKIRPGSTIAIEADPPVQISVAAASA